MSWSAGVPRSRSPSHPLREIRLFAAKERECPEREQKHDRERDQACGARTEGIVYGQTVRLEVWIENDRADVLEHLRERVQEADLSCPRRQIADGIDDRRRVEQHLQHEFPDLSDISETYEQRGENQSDREDEHIELEQQRYEEQPV